MANYSRSMAIAKKNLQIIIKDKRTVGMLIGMPIFMMVIFGFGFSQDVEHVPIKIVNFDQGGIDDTIYSDEFINLLENDDRVDIEELDLVGFDLEAERDKIYGPNDYFALVVIPVNFSENMNNSFETIKIEIYIYGSDVQSAGSIRGALAESIGELLNIVQGTDEGHLIIDTIYETGSEDLRPFDTMAPGILSFAILLFMILTVTGGFTKERITGTAFRTLVTPATKSDIIVGNFIGNSLIAMIQVSLLLIIAKLIFDVTIVGNVFLLFFILFIYALGCVGLSIFFSSFAKNELQAFQFIPLILIPSMFFSGFLFPLNSFPVVFQVIAKIIPMTYSIRMSRTIAVDGYGFEFLWKDFLLLTASTLFFMLLAIVVFRKQRNNK